MPYVGFDMKFSLDFAMSLSCYNFRFDSNIQRVQYTGIYICGAQQSTQTFDSSKSQESCSNTFHIVCDVEECREEISV